MPHVKWIQNGLNVDFHPFPFVRWNGEVSEGRRKRQEKCETAIFFMFRQGVNKSGKKWSKTKNSHTKIPFLCWRFHAFPFKEGLARAVLFLLFAFYFLRWFFSWLFFTQLSGFGRYLTFFFCSLAPPSAHTFINHSADWTLSSRSTSTQTAFIHSLTPLVMMSMWDFWSSNCIKKLIFSG